MAQVDTKTVEHVIADLAYALETALLRLEAYRRVVQQQAIGLADEIYALEKTLKDGPEHRQYIALRTQAIQSVRDSDVDALSEKISDLKVLARHGVGLRRSKE